MASLNVKETGKCSPTVGVESGGTNGDSSTAECERLEIVDQFFEIFAY